MKDGHESCHIFMSVFQFPSFCFQTGLPKSMKEATAMKNTEAFFSDVRDPGSWEALEISIQPDLFFNMTRGAGTYWPFLKKTCRFKAHILNFSDQEAVSIFYVLCMGLTDIPTLPPGGQRESMIWQMLFWASWLAEASSADTPKNDSWWKKRVKLTTSIYIYKAHRHYKQKLLSVILLFISCCKKQINVSTLPTFLVRQELLKIQNLICWHPKHQNIWILDLTSLGQKTQSAQNFTRQQWNI